MDDLRIGTSGWSYAHWNGRFYPPGLRGDRRLAHYASRFDTVEVNSTFYAPPRPEIIRRWAEAVPPGFLFAVKASRRLTHDRRLQATADEVSIFFRSLDGFGEKLGPVLFQLPPAFPCDPARLDAFLRLLPSGFRTAFEFRDPSWWNGETYALLKRHHAAFCLFDLNRKAPPVETTADWVYVRLHGPGRPYHDRYPLQTLKTWKNRIDQWRAEGKAVYLYFDNTEKACAACDASWLREQTGGPVLSLPETEPLLPFGDA